ncbi:unnamed protein product [Blepharisma stoltei]|uniref:Uncharacterized protein n=1 Tax=Blepharisma stoltei TaxID=1481888 RepID=A0AAU9JFQ7_9CILI|nr:unnamed protein product [Blepharisma stoltei]
MSEEKNSHLMENNLSELADASNLDNSIHTMKFIWASKCPTLSIFDAKTSQVENISLPTDQVLDKYGAKCLLPNGSLFYDNDPMTIIIYSEYHIKFLPFRPEQSSDACAVYNDRQIYLFGGTYNNSAKFNIADNIWSPLTALPLSLGSYTFGAAFRQCILLGSMCTNKILIMIP